MFRFVRQEKKEDKVNKNRKKITCYYGGLIYAKDLFYR